MPQRRFLVTGSAGLPDDIDVVFHLAALNGTQNFYERPLDVLRCCTLPTFRLWEKYGPAGRLRRFVYAGTSEAYAAIVALFGWEVPTGENVPLGIDDPQNPRWSYGASKLHGEVLTANAGRQFGVPFTIIRYHNVYGPRMGDKHVIPDFLMRAGHGIFELHGHEDTRAFMYIDDAIEATILAAQCDDLRNEVVNIGGLREIRIRDLGEMMMRAAGLNGHIKLFDSPKGSVRRRAPKLDKLRAATGFVERWTLERGLMETCRYYLAQDPAVGDWAAAGA